MTPLFAALPAIGWRGVGVVLVLCLAGYAWVQTKRVGVLSEQVEHQTERLKDTSARLNEAEQKLTVVQTEAQKQEQRLRDAEKKRQVVVQRVTEKVEVVRTQPVPQECTAALEFAVTNRGDLSWPN